MCIRDRHDALFRQQYLPIHIIPHFLPRGIVIPFFIEPLQLFLQVLHGYVVAVTLIPVSYTHLDVYKRQLMGISLSQKTDGRFRGIWRAILGFAITDEIFAVAVGSDTPLSSCLLYTSRCV